LSVELTRQLRNSWHREGNNEKRLLYVPSQSIAENASALVWHRITRYARDAYTDDFGQHRIHTPP